MGECFAGMDMGGASPSEGVGDGVSATREDLECIFYGRGCLVVSVAKCRMECWICLPQKRKEGMYAV